MRIEKRNEEASESHYTVIFYPQTDERLHYHPDTGKGKVLSDVIQLKVTVNF